MSGSVVGLDGTCNPGRDSCDDTGTTSVASNSGEGRNTKAAGFTGEDVV
ncbi:MAG TPA: hypothetical protein VMY37_22515 [Thermoguttaceae bacterium]|nr:hypothetical protein [Thermoguttaceae bacterium]